MVLAKLGERAREWLPLVGIEFNERRDRSESFRVTDDPRRNREHEIECDNDAEENAMIDVTQDIHSMTTFKRNSSGLMKLMKKTGRPLVLTVNGKAEAVVVDATAYREVAEQLDTIASIRRGLAQAKKGLGRPVDEVFDDLERQA